MNNFNEQYYIAFMPFGDEQLYVSPDQKTADRDFDFKKVPLGEAPFFFENGYKEEDKEEGNRWPITEIMMVGTSFIAIQEIRDELIKHDVDGMQLYPSVYIDDDDNWHENYWYLNFYKELHCLDKKRSKIDEDEDDDKDDDAEVLSIHLSARVLDAIPEEKRLLFKIGGTTLPYVLVHQKIVDFITQNNYKGIRFLKVSTFKYGDQHRP